MNFLVHENLPRLPELLSGLGEVNIFKGRQPSVSQLRNADVLFLRSVTKVDESLLDLAPNLKLIGTGTIGTDHIDKKACETRGIAFVSTPGANAASVGEYVFSAVLTVACRKGLSLAGKKALVVGAGHTGSESGKRLEALGMDVFYIDPDPALPAEDKSFVDWSFLPEADVVTLHIPLVEDGANPTYHLIDAEQLGQLKENMILVNASRGATINNRALTQFMKQENHKRIRVVLDVWEGEPQVQEELVEFVDIATPHIAGHSIEGKLKASLMLYQSLAQHFSGSFPTKTWNDIALEGGSGEYRWDEFPDLERLRNIVASVYNVELDDWKFRQEGLTTQGFDFLRQNYAIRREFSSVCVHTTHDLIAVAQAIGFSGTLINSTQ